MTPRATRAAVGKTLGHHALSALLLRNVPLNEVFNVPVLDSLETLFAIGINVTQGIVRPFPTTLNLLIGNRIPLPVSPTHVADFFRVLPSGPAYLIWSFKNNASRTPARAIC
jgi:hypothetical protein